MARTVSACFDSQEEAQRAVSALRELSIPDLALSVVVSDSCGTRTTTGAGEVTDHDHLDIMRGILGGGALGASLGIAALAIPGVGPVAAAGVIEAAALPEALAIGATAGASANSFREGLKKHGVSNEDAGYYGQRIKSGGVLVLVSGDSGVDPARAEDILYRFGGHSSTRAKIADSSIA